MAFRVLAQHVPSGDYHVLEKLWDENDTISAISEPLMTQEARAIVDGELYIMDVGLEPYDARWDPKKADEFEIIDSLESARRIIAQDVKEYADQLRRVDL